MSMKWMTLCVAFAFAVPSVAHADQCAWVSKDQAYAAQQKILNERTYVEYCKPCRETKATAPKVAKTAEIKKRKADYYELVIDGKAVDLAYTYYKQPMLQRSGEQLYQNLAEWSKCPVHDVPSLIKLGKDNEVLRPGA
jgi:hypothetical protein